MSTAPDSDLLAGQRLAGTRYAANFQGGLKIARQRFKNVHSGYCTPAGLAYAVEGDNYSANCLKFRSNGGLYSPMLALQRARLSLLTAYSGSPSYLG